MRGTMAIVGVLLVSGAVMPAQQPTITRTELQRADISVPGREAVSVRAEFPNGATTGRHTHPGEEISYVAEGNLSLEIEGMPAKTVKAGEAFLVPAGRVHNATAAGGRVVVIANYVAEKGKPLMSPVK